jgi:hypothetical protein
MISSINETVERPASGYFLSDAVPISAMPCLVVRETIALCCVLMA